MPLDPSYEQLITVNRETFAQGDYETACHVLMAVLERAHYLDNQQYLASVARLADEQLKSLQSRTLPARFVAEEGRRQKTLISLYSSIVQQSAAWRDLLHHRHQREAHQSQSVHEQPAERPSER